MPGSFNITGANSLPDATYGLSPRSPPDTGEPKAATPSADVPNPDPSDMRLIIEDAEEAGSFVYTTIDRRTGKVVRQMPREALLRLRETSDYTAGAVIKVRA